jgi:hypothetical protein
VLTLCPTRAARSPYSASPAPGADEWPGADRASWAPQWAQSSPVLAGSGGRWSVCPGWGNAFPGPRTVRPLVPSRSALKQVLATAKTGTAEGQSAAWRS